MVGQQNFLLRPQQRQRRDMKMVRMAMRDPNILTGLDEAQFVRCQFSIKCPTAKITGPRQPWIRREHRTFVLAECERRIAESFKTETHDQITFTRRRIAGPRLPGIDLDQTVPDAGGGERTKLSP